VFDLTQAASWNSVYINNNGHSTASAETALETALLGGKAYLNIHTSTFGGGEIRGFLTLAPVPEPATTCLAGGLLLGGFAAVRRLRRQA
jgi:hypothetical protein